MPYRRDCGGFPDNRCRGLCDAWRGGKCMGGGTLQGIDGLDQEGVAVGAQDDDCRHVGQQYSASDNNTCC